MKTAIGIFFLSYFVSFVVCYGINKKKILDEILDVDEIKKQSKGIMQNAFFLVSKTIFFAFAFVAFLYYSLIYIDKIHIDLMYVYPIFFIAQIALACLVEKKVKFQKYIFIIILLPFVTLIGEMIPTNIIKLFIWMVISYIIALSMLHLPKKKKLVEENITKDQSELDNLNKDLLKDIKQVLFRVFIITVPYIFFIYGVLTLIVGADTAEMIIYPLTFFVQLMIAYSFDKEKRLFAYSAVIASVSFVLAFLGIYGLDYLNVKLEREKMILNRYSVENVYRMYVYNYSAYNTLDIDVSVLEERYRLISPKTHFEIPKQSHKMLKFTVIARKTKGDRNREITFVIKNNFDDNTQKESYFKYW